MKEEKKLCGGDCEHCECDTEEEKPWAKDLEREVKIPKIEGKHPFDWEKDRIIPKKSQYPPHVLELPEVDKTDTFITGGHPMFHELLEKMRDIHNRKNADYGDGRQLGNFMEAEDFGVEAWRGALVRLSEKYSRVKSLAKRVNQEGEVKDESFEDTLIDLANYALLTLILYKENK